MKKITGIFFLVVLVLFVIAYGPSKSIVVSPETTYFTEPISEDGKTIDCWKLTESWFPKGYQTDANGFRMLAQKVDFSCEQNADELYQALGLDRNSLTFEIAEPNRQSDFLDFLRKKYPDETFSDPIDFNFRTIEGEYSEIISRRSETSERAKELAAQLENFDSGRSEATDDLKEFAEQWFARNDPYFALASRVVRQEIFFIPPLKRDMIIAAIYPGRTIAKDLARSFRFRAIYRISRGDLDGALDDVESLARLTASYFSDPFHRTTLDRLTGYIVDGSWSNIGLAGNPDVSPTREQWIRLQQILNETISEPDLRIPETERLAALDGLQYLMKNGIGEFDGENRLFQFGFDWNYIAAQINRFYSDPDWAGERFLELENDATSFSKRFRIYSPLRKVRSETVVDLLFSLYFPANQACREAGRRLSCSRNLEKINVALQRYRAENGDYPPAFSVDSEGKPLHSWRVLLLPYFGDDELTSLYKRVRLDESWNSEYNLEICRETPKIFVCPACPAKPNETNYSLVLDDGWSLETVGQENPDSTTSSDGNSEKDSETSSDSKRNEEFLKLVPQLLVVERTDPVVWTSPNEELTRSEVASGVNVADETGDRSFLKRSFSACHSGGANAGTRDGAIRFVSENF